MMQQRSHQYDISRLRYAYFTENAQNRDKKPRLLFSLWKKAAAFNSENRRRIPDSTSHYQNQQKSLIPSPINIKLIQNTPHNLYDIYRVSTARLNKFTSRIKGLKTGGVQNLLSR